MPSTFFLVIGGEQAMEDPSLESQAFREGHFICWQEWAELAGDMALSVHHSYQHLQLLSLPAQQAGSYQLSHLPSSPPLSQPHLRPPQQFG